MRYLFLAGCAIVVIVAFLVLVDSMSDEERQKTGQAWIFFTVMGVACLAFAAAFMRWPLW